MEITTMTLEERILKNIIKCWLYTNNNDTPLDYRHIDFDKNFVLINGDWGSGIRYYKDIFVDYKKWKLQQ